MAEEEAQAPKKAQVVLAGVSEDRFSRVPAEQVDVTDVVPVSNPVKPAAISPGAQASAKIADAAVTDAKIADAAVTDAKIENLTAAEAAKTAPAEPKKAAAKK